MNLGMFNLVVDYRGILDRYKKQNIKDIFKNRDVYTEFFETEKYKQCGAHVKSMLEYIFEKMIELDIDFYIKVTKKAIAITLDKDRRRNIIKIWTLRFHICILIVNTGNIFCYKIEDLNDELFEKIIRKYEEVRSPVYLKKRNTFPERKDMG